MSLTNTLNFHNINTALYAKEILKWIYTNLLADKLSIRRFFRLKLPQFQYFLEYKRSYHLDNIECLKAF